MRTVHRRLLAGAVMLVAGVTSASAADLNGGSLKDYGVAPMPMTYASPSSWYVRGDVSYATFDAPTLFEHDTASEYDLTRTGIGNTWGIGGGIGRYLGTNTRADITVDWFRKSTVSGYQSPIVDGSGCGCIVNLPGTHQFDLQSTVGLLNFYYDFGNRSHFSPYVGAGIGFVHHTAAGGTIIDSTNNGTTGTIDSRSRTDLAAALMAGVSVALRTNMHLDAGYRFVYMGKAETGAVNGSVASSTAGPPSYSDPTLTDIHSHQIRVGLRYDFGG